MAATPRLTAVMNIVNIGRPCREPKIKTRKQMARTVMPSTLPVCARCFFRGVSGAVSCWMRLAILPTCVSIPVWVTTAVAWPDNTTDPALTILIKSPREVSSFNLQEAFFFTGSDSPVREDSSTLSPSACNKRASAGTMEPAERTMISPGTSSLVGRTVRLPSRIT